MLDKVKSENLQKLSALIVGPGLSKDGLILLYDKSQKWLNFSLKGNVVLAVIAGVILLLK